MQGEARRPPSRREIIAAGGATAFAFAAGLGLAPAAAVASGHVFHERGGMGRRRPGDPGIAGVMVSNGREVTSTDADGRWVLPVSASDCIFVIKPSGWATPIGPGGVPCFSSLRSCGDGGDASVRDVEGAATSGALTMDFPLTRQSESSAFQVVLMADTQPASNVELDYLRDDILAGVAGCGAAFGINHGDVAFDDLSLYPRYLQLLGTSAMPWHHCPGNHDIDREALDDHLSRQTWKRTFGPRHYAFQYADATFIILDNVYYHGNRPGAALSGRYSGLIGETQLQFVRNMLAMVPPDRLVVVSMHIPLVNGQDPRSAADNTVDRRALLGLLSGRRYSVSFSGHMHLTEHHYLGTGAGFGGPRPHHHHVLTAASGGWWGGLKDSRGIPAADSQDGSPNGYHILTVDGCRYTTRFVPASGKTQAQLRATIDLGPRHESQANDPPRTVRGASILNQSDLGRCELVVNVFDGGPSTRVRYDIVGTSAAPLAMQRIACPDPYVARLFASHAEVQKPWVSAVPSSHIWRAPLPDHLRPGAYCARVHAEDEYGRALAANVLFEVSGPGAGT